MKRALIVVGIVIISLIILSFVGLTFVSYQVIDSIGKNDKINRKTKINVTATSPTKIQTTSQSNTVFSSPIVSQSHNRKTPEVIETDEDRLDSQFEVFLTINRLRDELKNVEMPNLCNIICEPTNFKFVYDKTDPVFVIVDYYYKTGPMALSDPKFRFAYQRSAILSDILNQEIFDVLKEIEVLTDKESSMSEVQKVWLATRLAPAVMLQMNTLEQNMKKSEKTFKYFDKVEKLAKECKSKGPELIVKECQQLSIK